MKSPDSRASCAGCSSAFQMRSRLTVFDGITCGSVHLEIGPAPSDANRRNPQSRRRTCPWNGSDSDKWKLTEEEDVCVSYRPQRDADGGCALDVMCEHKQKTCCSVWSALGNLLGRVYCHFYSSINITICLKSFKHHVAIKVTIDFSSISDEKKNRLCPHQLWWFFLTTYLPTKILI